MAERAPDGQPRRRRTDPQSGDASATPPDAPEPAPDAPDASEASEASEASASEAPAPQPEASEPPHRRASDPPPEPPAPRRRASDAEPTVSVPPGSEVTVDEATGDANVVLPPPPPRSRGRRALDAAGRVVLNVTVVVLGLVAAALLALWVATNTDWGRERVRRLAIEQFDEHTNGRLRIGRVSGNLLQGFTFHAISITETNGAPFVAADSVRARYSFRGLLRKRIDLDDVVLWRPVVVLDNPPNGKWNWQRIFPGKGPQPPKPKVPGFGDWITATDVRVVDGDVLVKTTWRPSKEKPKAEQEADIREALAGDKRDVIVRHPAGFQKVMRFRDLDGTFPKLIIADPRYHWRVFEVATANLIAEPFHPPYADVRDLRGTFRMDGDSVWWQNAFVRMPGSRVTGDGRYWFTNNDAWIRGHGEQIALADWRWAYTRLPSQGGGPADIEYRFNDDFMTFRARDMDMRIGAQRARGSVGMTFVDAGAHDTLVVHDTRLRLTNVDVKLAEQLLDFESPRHGTISGLVNVKGGVHAMKVDGDVEFRDVRSGYNHLIGGGTVAFLGGKTEPGVEKDVVLRNAQFRLAPLQVGMITQGLKPPPIPIGGSVTGRVRLDYWSVENGGTVVGDVVHVDRGDRSAFTGRATLKYATTPPWFDVDGTVHPLSLALANRFAPKLGLRGLASGPLKVRGTLDDLSLDTDLSLAGGGSVAARGRIAMGPRVPFYDLAVRMRDLNVGAVVAGQPSSSLTGTAELRGRGTTPETLEGTYAVDLRASRWDTLAVDSVVGRVRVADGLLAIDRMVAAARGIDASAEGSFGMRAGREGTLSYRVAVADLGALRSVVPGLAGDTGVVQPRPGILAERVRRARADSIRVARATEIERIVTGRKMAPVVVDTPRAVPKGALGGSLVAAGTAHGWVRDFDLRGRAAGTDVMARGNFAKAFRAEYAWTNARTAQSSLALGLDADSVSAMGFAFDTVNARLAYAADRTGRVEVVARQGADRDYAVRGDFVFHPQHNELHLADATFRFDTTTWALAQPATIQWGDRGIAVQNVDLRNGSVGRIWVNGLLPTEGVANLDAAMDDVPLAHLAAIAQSDVDVTGHLTLRAHMAGTLKAPVFSGSFGVPDATYGGTTVPQLRGTFAYADASLNSHVLAVRADTLRPLAVVDATVPVNLALSGVEGPRLGKEGYRVDVAADSLPLDLVPRFTDAVSDMTGFAAGRLVMRGSLDRPSLTGAIVVRDADATVTASGMRLVDINGAVRMLNDTVRVDSLVGRAGKGDVRLSGGLAVGNWREPTFDLHLTANDAQVLHDDRGDLHADMALALTGPFKQSYVSGQVTIVHGVLYIPESRNVENIGPGDPALFAVLDTAVLAERELLPAENPLFENLRVDVDVQVNRNTWVRTRDANVEVFSDGMVHVHRERVGAGRAALALTGIIASERGEYRLFSKRFQVRRGSAVFIGSPELNPTIQATAEYEVRPPGREAVNIRILIGGTLDRMRLSLETDAQPPMSQSDILSFLAFSRETASLLDLEGSVLSSQSGNPNLVGVTKTAGRRLASVALGLAVDEIEGEAGRDLGVDVINITPEDVPTDFGMNGVQNFLLGTRIEAGKYVNPRTFVALYGNPSWLTGGGTVKSPPGVRLEHRVGDGWRIQTSLEPQLRLRDPSLTIDPNPVSPISVFGLFFIREWRF